VDEVRRLLSAYRLVILAGVGGVGKTRLALRVAAQVHPTVRDGVWFVDLATVPPADPLTRQMPNPDSLAALVAAALDMHERSARPPLQSLTGYLARRRLLLLLDSCDRLVPACAALADQLLRACPGLRILATSREPLGVYGEALFVVPPLSTPDPFRTLTLSESTGFESMALFAARAKAVLPGFGITEGNQEAVARICHRLEGLPLAIELAAARLHTLTPHQLLDRLADRFALPGASTPDAPDRQQTLRACVDWSFDLCSRPERTLWARLSVFAGAFELEAVEGICTDDELPEGEVLDVVVGLMDKSILARENHGDRARYRMLETIREYGLEKLAEAGDETRLRRRHCQWYHEMVVQARAQWISDRQAYWLDRLRREHPNLRAAVQNCVMEGGEAERALRIVVLLPLMYWGTAGLLGDGRRWLDVALARATAPSALRARALLLNGQLAIAQGQARTGRLLLADGQRLAERLDEPIARAHAAYVNGLAALFRGEPRRAAHPLEQGLALLSSVSQPESELELQLELLLVRAMAAGLVGDWRRAAACHEEMLAISRPRGEGYYRSYAMWVRGLAAWRQGDLEEAEGYEVGALRLKQAQPSQDRYGVALCLETLAWIRGSQQQHRRAAFLLGAAGGIWADLGIPISWHRHLVAYHEACERQARDALGNAAFRDAVRHGRRLPYDILADQLRERDQPEPGRPPGPEDAGGSTNDAD
jgi:predicted ATPase